MKRAWIALLACIPLLAAAQWTQVPGALTYVTVGSATNIWGVNASDNIWRWNGSTWVQVPGALRFISAGADGSVWGVNSSAAVFQWNGHDWDRKSGGLSAVAVANANTVYGLTQDNGDGTGGTLYKWNGSGWITLDPQNAMNISSVAPDAAGNLWLTMNPGSRIFYWPAGVRYMQPIAGGLIQVAGGGRYVMGLNKDGQIWRWTGRTWRQVPGALKWISVSSDGQMWGVNKSGNIFRGTAIPADPEPVAGTDGAAVLPYGQYLTNKQCLVSTNKRYKACIEQGLVSVQQIASSSTYYASPYGPELDVNQAPVFDSRLVSDTDGSVCVTSPRGRRWCAVDATEAKSVLWMQDDGNLCAYPGANLTSISGPARWCSNTGHGAMRQALQAYPQTPYSDVKTALDLFDAGMPLLMPFSTYATNAAIIDQGMSACYELTNTASRALLVQSFWYGNSSVRDWAVIAPGQKLRFDNRGTSQVACMNCDSRATNNTGNTSATHIHWGSQLSLDLVGVKDQWPPGGCHDMLGLGPSH